MSLNNLKNNEFLNSNPNNFGNNLGLTPVRVFSVILDNTHPKYTGEDSIGTIFYGKVSLNESSISLDNLNRAKPSFSFVKQYPLVNEIVLVFNSTTNNIYSDTKGDNAFTSTYYFPNLNVWNNSQHNALPLERDLKNQENSQEAGVGIQQNNVIKSNIKLGEYFVEKDTLKSLQPFEGDVIFEGRFGQGLRFGSSNPRGKNNWSENDSLGAPITVLSNGHNQASGDAILEDINNTDSLIVMTSEHNINNLEVASSNMQSLNTTFEQPSATQILIDNTPTKIIETTPPEETEFIETTDSIEETITQESPPPTSPSSGDSIFDLLDEAVEEGLLEYDDSYDDDIAGPGDVEDLSEISNDNNNPDIQYGGATDEQDNFMFFPNQYDRNKVNQTINGIERKKWNEQQLTENEGKNITLFNKNLDPVYIGNGIHRNEINIKNDSGDRNIKYIFIHTTAGNSNRSPGEVVNGFLNPGGSRNWDYAGYHWMVTPDGKAFRIYKDTIPSRGVGKSNTIDRDFDYNDVSININWIGGLEATKGGKGFDMTADQALTIKKLVIEYINSYPDAKVIGHNQKARKECPWFWVPSFALGIGIDKEKIDFSRYSLANDKITRKGNSKIYGDITTNSTYIDVSKKMLVDFCGIPWDDAYKEDYQNYGIRGDNKS